MEFFTLNKAFSQIVWQANRLSNTLGLIVVNEGKVGKKSIYEIQSFGIIVTADSILETNEFEFAAQMFLK